MSLHMYQETVSIMMMSSDGNIFRVISLCVGKSPVTGEFPSQMPVARGFDIFFDLRLNKQLSKQSRRGWFEIPLRWLWRHSSDFLVSLDTKIPMMLYIISPTRIYGCTTTTTSTCICHPTSGQLLTKFGLLTYYKTLEPFYLPHMWLG